MAITVLKKTPIHCVVKVSGASTETITLATTLLFGPNEVANNPRVDIMGLHWCIPGATAATVVRNGVTVFSLIGAWGEQFNGFSDTQENESNISVTIPAGGGQVILELLKVSGYGNTQHRNFNQDG